LIIDCIENHNTHMFEGATPNLESRCVDCGVSFLSWLNSVKDIKGEHYYDTSLGFYHNLALRND